MCINSADMIPSSTFISAFRHTRPSKRHNLRVRRLNRRRSRGSSKNAKRKEKVSLKAKLEVKNLRLYRKNQSIIQENEKLRRKALLLHQENQELLSEIQKKFPYLHNQQLINH